MISILLIILFSVSHCNADLCLCKCCNGPSCTPVLQGNISVPTCTPSPCIEQCQNKYPEQCTDGLHKTSHDCIVNRTPNWIGEFNTTNQCDTNSCCCPRGQLSLSTANTDDMLRIRCSLVGMCPSEEIDLNIPMPSTFETQLDVFNAPILLSLSTDSNTMEIINSPCNERAIRNIALSSTTISATEPSSSTTTLVPSPSTTAARSTVGPSSSTTTLVPSPSTTATRSTVGPSSSTTTLVPSPSTTAARSTVGPSSSTTTIEPSSATKTTISTNGPSSSITTTTNSVLSSTTRNGAFSTSVNNNALLIVNTNVAFVVLLNSVVYLKQFMM